MVTIEINKSDKCNGDYSLFVTFEYNAKIVDIMRNQVIRYWHPDMKCWELPLKVLNKLQNELSEYHINLVDNKNILNKIKNEGSESLIPKDYKFKTKPFKHQLEGIEYGLKYDRFLLADEQGCIGGNCKVQVKCSNDKATMKMKLKNLYKHFHDSNSRFYKNMQIKSLINGRFRYYKIKDVIYSGFKQTIKIYTDNHYITCTPDHLIYTPNGWVEAQNLSITDTIFTNGIECCPMCGTTKNLVTYQYAKYRGYCHNCVNKWLKDGRKYKGDTISKKLNEDGYVVLRGKPLRKRINYKDGILEHIYVYEQYLGYEIDTSIYVVHHKNGIKTDNRLENLQLLTKSEHAKIHSDTKMYNLPQLNKNISEIKKGNAIIYLCPQESKITKIEKDLNQDVYDIVLDNNEGVHNFVCNNFIVHNCGKTMQIINIACIRKQTKGYKHCLIICGVNGLKWNWRNEIEKHSNEKGYILGTRYDKSGKEKIGSMDDRLEDLNGIENAYNTRFNGIFDTYPYFLITNIETLRDEKILNELQTLCNIGVINMIALDEGHKCKDPTSIQGKALLKLEAETMISMTGTPIMNNPLDAYIHLRWLGYEKHSFYPFKQHYCVFGGFGGYQIVAYRNLDQLKEQFDDIMLRRLKKDVLDLPDKIYIDEYVEMTPKQNKIYKEVKAEIKENIDMVVNAINPLAEMIRLRQATDYTGILSSTIQESAKLDRLEELLQEIVANNEKAIIFSNWTSVTNPVFEKLKKYNPAIITGETKDRVEQQDKFMNDDSCKIIIGTIGAMGTGLTLTAATNVIFLDEPWNMAIKSQAEDRAHRIGTKSNVNIITLMCKDTIDERIHELVQKKGALADLLVDGKMNTQNKSDLVNFLLN